MKRSSDRILTTHVGSLARPAGLLELIQAKDHGESYDSARFDNEVRDAVREVVARQAGAGLDVIADGEQGKISFFTYVRDRLGGFELAPGRSLLPESWRLEIDMFPEYYEEYLGRRYAKADSISTFDAMVCRAPVTYQGHDAVRRDIANLESALADVDVEEAFLPATAPQGFGENEYYATEDEYMVAVAEALREEYLAIVDAGLLLQIDDPFLIEDLMAVPGTTEEGRRAAAARHIEILNHALRGIPEEKIRLHTCYGLNHGPRLHDVPFAEVVDLMLSINAGAYSFEAGNPRHQHDWHIWETTKLPDGKILIPGFLCHAHNFVEHPELIADWIVQYANLVGRENVIAGVDCGFSSRATPTPEVHPTVGWAKFEALADGARLATQRLW